MDLSVNAVKYRSLLIGFVLLDRLRRINICGDSNLVIRPIRGKIDCKPPEIQLLRHKAMQILQSWPKHEFLHIKRKWNQSADRLARLVLQQETVTIVTSDSYIQDLISFNRFDELVLPERIDRVANMAAVIRSTLLNKGRTRCSRRSGTTDSDRADQERSRGGMLDHQREEVSGWEYDPDE